MPEAGAGAAADTDGRNGYCVLAPLSVSFYCSPFFTGLTRDPFIAIM